MAAITYTENVPSTMSLYFPSRDPPQLPAKNSNSLASCQVPHLQDATGVDIERCNAIIRFIREGTKPSSLQELLKVDYVSSCGELELNDVFPQDQEYIMKELAEFDHFAIKFTCFPDQNKITLTMPSSGHETPINIFSSDLNRAIDSIGHNRSVVQVHVGANTEFKGKTIRSIPDLHISIHVPDLDRDPETLWMAEFGFTQSKPQIMRKLARYITDCPTLRVLMMVNIELQPFANPSMKSPTTQALSHIPTLPYREWSPGNRRLRPFGPIVTHGHCWMSVSSIELEVWIAKPGEKIDLSNHDATVYASGSLHPSVDTKAVDAILQRALQVVRDRIIVAINDVIEDENRRDEPDDSDHPHCLRNACAWKAPLDPVQWLGFRKATMSGVWWTAYNRYLSFHKDVLERRPDSDDAAAGISTKKPKRS